ncbi:MAG: signal peptide protein [Gammaproteobacteria bacterium]|nr:signal peptide protein [Gammaproteobacteria bacterium]
MRAPFRIAIMGVALLSPIPPTAASDSDSSSPVGVWKTFDDKTGDARAIVRIYEQNGRLFGKIERSFTPGSEHRVCVLCSDERKNQPIIGLVVIRNIRQNGNEYAGGDILDPESGSIYRCKMHLEQNGTRLVLRGFIGFSLLGRTQTWQRQG